MTERYLRRDFTVYSQKPEGGEVVAAFHLDRELNSWHTLNVDMMIQRANFAMEKSEARMFVTEAYPPAPAGVLFKFAVCAGLVAIIALLILTNMNMGHVARMMAH